jgi:hypothetical protein
MHTSDTEVSIKLCMKLCSELRPAAAHTHSSAQCDHWYPLAAADERSNWRGLQLITTDVLRPAEEKISMESNNSNKSNVGGRGGNHTNKFTAVLKRIHWY